MKSAQEQIKNLFNEINEKKGLKPDPYYSFVRIVEEIGEIARQIFNKKIRPEKYNEKNFKEEIVDLVIELLYYSSLHGIEIEKKIFDKLEKIRQSNLGNKSKNIT